MHACTQGLEIHPWCSGGLLQLRVMDCMALYGMSVHLTAHLAGHFEKRDRQRMEWEMVTCTDEVRKEYAGNNEGVKSVCHVRV